MNADQRRAWGDEQIAKWERIRLLAPTQRLSMTQSGDTFEVIFVDGDFRDRIVFAQPAVRFVTEDDQIRNIPATNLSERVLTGVIERWKRHVKYVPPHPLNGRR